MQVDDAMENVAVVLAAVALWLSVTVLFGVSTDSTVTYEVGRPALAFTFIPTWMPVTSAIDTTALPLVNVTFDLLTISELNPRFASHTNPITPTVWLLSTGVLNGVEDWKVSPIATSATLEFDPKLLLLLICVPPVAPVPAAVSAGVAVLSARVSAMKPTGIEPATTWMPPVDPDHEVVTIVLVPPIVP
jgi:hypothetical protein